MKKILIACLCLILVSCGDYTKQTSGTGIGAAIGTLGGLILSSGGSGVSQRRAALIGAGIGALAGGGIGRYMDRQEKELRKNIVNPDIKILRSGNTITLNMPNNITFDTGHDYIKPDFYGVLNSISAILTKYERTFLEIHGHTDSTGSYEFNHSLSQRRATNVARALQSQGIDYRRLLVKGFGETKPVASNTTTHGRQLNRRVEIRIVPIS